MNNEKLIINGSGSSKGGKFQTVEINGSGIVTGDIECESLRFNGSGKADGKVKAEEVIISGSGKITGAVEADSIHINGSASIHGNLQANKVKVAGFSSFGGFVKGEDLTISGKASIAEDCEIEMFQSEGKFSVGGLLNADDVNIRLSAGESKAQEIGCRRIVVKSRRGVLSLFKLLPSPVLTAHTIEGDEIDLADTKAKIVRGNSVKIGPGCHIELVEYSGQFECDQSATVAKSQRI
ncbi:hypothetical protein RA13_18880 [Bacillus atrophaeus]|nr:hypothetical protein RA13_18880 [Bacillus atrophaeus]